MFSISFWAQIIGLIASIICIAAIQARFKKHYLLWITIGNAFFIFNFLLLGAYAGATICVLDVTLSFLVKIFESKNKSLPKFIIVFFYLLFLIAGILTYENFYSLIAIVCGLLFVVRITAPKMKKLRIISLTTSLLWIIYDLCVGAYTGLISDVFDATSALIALWRFRQQSVNSSSLVRIH